MANKQLKEILDMAIQVKTDAYEFYSAAANIAKDPSAKELLKEFANIELKHKEKFEKFDLNEVEEGHHTVKKTHDFHIEQYLLDKEITPDSTVQDIMIHVMKREQKIYAFYDNMLKVVTSIPVRNLFEELAAEELEHKVKIETEYDDFFYKED
jgi:rubrerythrin